MKLSEVSTSRASDILCELSVFFLNMCNDNELIETLKSEIKVENGKTSDLYNNGLKKISLLVPLILKKHKKDVFGIVAAMNETTIEKIYEQNFIITLKQIQEIIEDKDLIDFFISCFSAKKK